MLRLARAVEQVFVILSVRKEVELGKEVRDFLNYKKF
jgi:hypothetical protein